jgi:hypothetical protein
MKFLRGDATKIEARVFPALEFGDAQTDTPHDIAGRGFRNSQAEEFYRMFEGVRTKDKVVGFKADISKRELVGNVHSVQAGAGWQIGRE